MTARWGSAGKGGATMPGPGRAIERDYTDVELDRLSAHFEMPAALVHDILGVTTFDVYINDDVFWSNVPTNVWHFELGGYQVLKKWLSYRERVLLGRDMSREEV